MKLFNFKTILLLFLIISGILTKKKSKSKTVSSNKRPSHIEPYLYCEACKGVVFLSTVSLRDNRSDYEMYAVFEKICDMKNYPDTLPFPPPYMSEACQVFMEHWEPELELLISRREIGEE